MTEALDNLTALVYEEFCEIPFDCRWLLPRQIPIHGMCIGAVDIDLKKGDKGQVFCYRTSRQLLLMRRLLYGLILTIEKTSANSMPSNLHQQKISELSRSDIGSPNWQHGKSRTEMSGK